MGKNKNPVGSKPVSATKSNDSLEGLVRVSDRFSLLNKLITRDLNNNISAPTFSKYTKDDIAK